MLQKQEIDSLLKTCESAKDSVDAFLRSLNDYEAVIEELPAIARPLVRRDLESNTGMNADEWHAFLERLRMRFGTIHDAAQRLSVTYGDGNEAEVAAAITTLREVSTPFREGVDIAIEQLETIALYLEGVPQKINIVPDSFLNADVRDELISAIPGRVERARALKDLLEKTKRELSEITA